MRDFINPKHTRSKEEIARIEELLGPDDQPVGLTEEEKEINRIFAIEQCRQRRERKEAKQNENKIKQQMVPETSVVSETALCPALAD